VDIGYDIVRRELLAKVGQTLGTGPSRPPSAGTAPLARSLAS
jgi:hypothetical protein